MKFTLTIGAILGFTLSSECKQLFIEETDIQEEFPQKFVNQTPIIGIISQPLEDFMHDMPEFDAYNSYIMSDYIKYMEQSGARVVPLIHGEPWGATKDKLDFVNGVLFPGGGGDYYDFGEKIYNYGKEKNDQGIQFPMWGTCLGFENILGYESGLGNDVLTQVDSHDISLPLHFLTDPKWTKMFKHNEEAAHYMANNDVTYNSHTWGVLPETYQNSDELKHFFMMTSLSYNATGDPFIATVEAHQYPIFATQFHPEKVPYIFYDGQHLDHDFENMKMQRHFSDLMGMHLRMNDQTFGEFKVAKPFLIQNYDLVLTDTALSNVYAFKV